MQAIFIFPMSNMQAIFNAKRIYIEIKVNITS